MLGLKYSKLYSELVGEWDIYSRFVNCSALSFGGQQIYPLMCYVQTGEVKYME